MHPRSERTYDSSQDPTANKLTTDRVTVAEAAKVLGLSAEAVRMRVKRGTLASDKVDGTVYVILDAEPTRPNGDQTYNETTDPMVGLTSDQTDLVDTLRSEVDFLRKELKRREEVHVEENRRKDTIIAQLTQRIPELPSASTTERHDSRETFSQASGQSGVAPDSPEAVHRRSWLYRFFFGP
jgi:hypothetical protein